MAIAETLPSPAGGMYAEMLAALIQGASAMPPRLAVSVPEAARMCGVSPDFFEKYWLPHLRVVREGIGRRKTTRVPVSEIRDLLARRGSRLLDPGESAETGGLGTRPTGRRRRADGPR